MSLLALQMSPHSVDSDRCSTTETAENRNDDPLRESHQPNYSLKRWSEEAPRDSIWSSFNLRTRVVRVKVVEESLEEWREKCPAPGSIVMSLESALFSRLGQWHDISMQLCPSFIFCFTKDTGFSTACFVASAQKSSVMSEGCSIVALFEDNLLHQNKQTRGPSPWRPKSPSISEGSVPSWTVGSTESSENCTTTSEPEVNVFPQIVEDASTWAYPKLNEKPWESFEEGLKANKIESHLKLDSIISRTGQQLHLCVFTTTIDPIVERPLVEKPQMPSNSLPNILPQMSTKSSNFLDESNALVKRKPSPVTELGEKNNNIKRLKVCPDPQGENTSRVGFGCPFCKANPGKYRYVYGACTFPPGFDIKRITEHLKRNHSSKHCCKNCRKKFTGAAEKAQRELFEHIKRGGCDTKLESVADPERMSERQEECLISIFSSVLGPLKRRGGKLFTAFYSLNTALSLVLTTIAMFSTKKISMHTMLAIKPSHHKASILKIGLFRILSRIRHWSQIPQARFLVKMLQYGTCLRVRAAPKNP